MSEGESWQQLMNEASPSAMKPADIAMLGPPPRDLMPAHEKYIKAAKPSFTWLWTTLAVLSIGSYAMMMAIVGFETSMLTGMWFPAGTVGLAIWTARRASRRRGVLRRVFRDGHLRFARLEECIQIPVGRGLARRYRYISRFDVDGRKVGLVNMNDGMSLTPIGTLVEVLYLPDASDEIVPTFLLV